MSRRSDETRRQKEKEAKSRRRLQEQAYREAERGVYDRIYREQNVRPDDFEETFREERDRPVGEKKRGRPVLVTLLLMLVALVASALAAHAILVHRPEIPQEETVSETGNPGQLDATRREEVYTFLLVGRDDMGGGNTDTIMVGCFDVKNGAMDVLSIYRDTLVDVPWEIKKINSVYNLQGIEGLQAQIKNLIGYQPDYYFVMEMGAVAQIVDALGGVDFDVPYNMHYDDPAQDLHIHFEKGMQHLDGENAVKLLRWRKNNSGENLSVGDIGRVEIQHQFLKALVEQTIQLGNITKITQVASIVDKNLTSDLTYGEMLWFGERALGMTQENIRFYSLPGDYTGTIWSPTYQNYQSYVFVNPSVLLDLVNEHLNPYRSPITASEQHIIHGTDVNSQPSLPTATGLPIIQEGEITGNEMELPSGTVQISNDSSGETSEGTTRPAQTAQSAETSQSAENMTEEPEQLAVEQNQSPDQTETGETETQIEPEQAPEQPPVSEPELEAVPDPIPEPAEPVQAEITEE